MRRFILALVPICLLATACAGTSADPLIGAARQPGAVFYVENHGSDERNLEQSIADVLRARGVEVDAGPVGQRPANVRFVVSYEDHWAWDMRTYLREIEITVRDAKTGAIVGQSRSHQDSLSSMGQTYQAIVQRTTNQLFDGAP